MERDEYRRHFELEESHWWFRSRRTLVFRLIRARVRAFLPLSPQILDAGCGTGINLARLGDFGRAFGCDIAAEALAFSRERGLRRLAQADANRLPFLAESFDLVTFFDVLYHRDIPDDTATLRETGRILRPGGFCLITDSALEKLRGPHDEAHHGARRYDKAGLRAKLEAAGFEVVYLTYFFMTTYPAVSLRRRLERRRATRRPKDAAKSDLSLNPGWLDAAMTGLLKLEAGLATHRPLPVGSSIVALARKPAGRGSPL